MEDPPLAINHRTQMDSAMQQRCGTVALEYRCLSLTVFVGDDSG